LHRAEETVHVTTSDIFPERPLKDNSITLKLVVKRGWEESHEYLVHMPLEKLGMLEKQLHDALAQLEAIRDRLAEQAVKEQQADGTAATV
jgi:hypothetical protein